MSHHTEPGPASSGVVLPFAQEPRLIVTRGSDVTPVATRWLWPGWLAVGKLHLLAGPPGTGKTTIAASWAAILSRGGTWPDGNPAEAGDVLLWSGEDGNADTLNPRLRAAGADMDRISTIDGMVHAPPVRSPFDPARDLPHLASVLGSRQIRLLILDPIVAAVSGDSHKNAEVRRSLQPLVDLATTFDVAVLGITHLSKGTAGRDPLERITGSLAFGAVARLAFVTSVDASGETEMPARRVVRVKSNLGPDGGGFRYAIEPCLLDRYPGVTSSSIRWGEVLSGDARTLLGAAPDVDAMRPRDEAAQFLLQTLAAGPMSAATVKALAAAAGLSERTLERAKARLGLKSEKGGMDGGWTWRIIDNPP